MLRGLLALIGLGSRNEGPVAKFDFDKAWSFLQIRDKHRFLKWVLSIVPDGTVWNIEGVYDPAILEVLREFPATDNVRISRATIWPRQHTLKVLLTEASKAKLASCLEKWNLDGDLIHQHIYSDTAVYFRSYDNLHENCTWVSHLISRDQLEPLIAGNVVSLDEDVNHRDFT